MNPKEQYYILNDCVWVIHRAWEHYLREAGKEIEGTKSYDSAWEMEAAAATAERACRHLARLAELQWISGPGRRANGNRCEALNPHLHAVSAGNVRSRTADGEMKDMNYKITITKHGTGETVPIFRDVCTTHPKWVHDQCGTSSEVELQTCLDGLNVTDWYEDGKHLGPDTSGIEMTLTGE